MKQFFTGAVPSLQPSVALSVEEEAILVDEINGCQAAAQQTADELTHSEDLVDGMEDMLIVADTMEAPADAQTAQLAVSFSEMATAGSDAEPEALIGDPSLSSESIAAIKDTIKRIWDTIVAALKRLWGHIAALFNRFRALFASYKDRYKGLEKDLAAVQGAAYDDRSAVGVANQVLLSGGDQTKPATAWANNLGVVESLTKIVFQTGLKENLEYSKMLGNYIGEVRAAMEKNKGSTAVGDDVIGATQDFIEKMARAKSEVMDATKQHHHATGFFGAYIGDAKVMLVNDLPGGGFLEFDGGRLAETHAEGEDNLLNLLRALTHGKYTMRSHNLSGEQQFYLPAPREANRMAKEAGQGIDLVLAYLTQGKASVEAAAKDIQTKIDHLVKNVGDVKGPARDYVNVIMQMGKHFNMATTGLGQEVLAYLRKQYASNEKGLGECLKQYQAGVAKK